MQSVPQRGSAWLTDQVYESSATQYLQLEATRYRDVVLTGSKYDSGASRGNVSRVPSLEMFHVKHFAQDSGCVRFRRPTVTKR